VTINGSIDIMIIEKKNEILELSFELALRIIEYCETLE
jgi:hypothetical protein